MSNLQLIEALCNVCEQLLLLVRHSLTKLEEADALDCALRQEAETVFASYAKTIGANEAPEVFAHKNS